MMLRKLAYTLLCMTMAMAAYGQSTRPPFLPIWAVTAIPTTDILQPNNAYISAGWPLSSTPPSRQYFNWVLNRGTWGVDYLLHRGIADWDSATTYGPNDLVIGSNGRIYRSTQSNNVGNAPPNTSFWNVPAIDAVANGDNSASIASTAFVHNNYVPIGGGFSLLGGQIGAGQVPLGAVNQWQSFLSISWSQISGVPLDQSGTVANSIAQRNGGGYLFANYFNQNLGANENPPIGQVIVNNTTDTFNRKASFVNFQNQQNLANIGGQVTAGQVPQGAVTQYSPQVFQYNPQISRSTSGCAQIPGGILIQWGIVAPNGGTITAGYSCGPFPNAALSVISNGQSAVTQSNVTGWNANNFTIRNTGGASNYIAIGY